MRLLGRIEAWAGGRAVSLGGPHRVAVFTLLALRAGSVVPVAELVEALWDGKPPKSAVANVHGHISALRAAVREAGGPAEVLVTRSPGYMLDLGAGGHTDLAMFEDLREAALARRDAPAEAAELYRRALACWTGPALHDLPSPVLRRHAERLERRLLLTVRDKAEMELALGLHDVVIAETRPVLQADPHDERLRAVLMLALYRAGRQADALAVYREGRRALVEDLGLEPGPELRRLEKAILAQEPGLDLSVPFARAHPRQLPPAPALLLGRDDELASLCALLTSQSVGALTTVALTGHPGVGTSALALRVAHAVRPAYPDGQLYASLGGPGRDERPPEVVLDRFLRALGVPAAALPGDLAGLAELFRTVLADQRVLVVLDDAAGETQVRPLLPGGAGCAVILTSGRSLAGLDTSATLRVRPLAVRAAAAMFTALSGRDGPEVGEVGALCDGLPLAIRLAAARLAARPRWQVADLHRRLADDRLRLDLLTAGDLSVRGAYDRTYSGLGEAAGRALRLLAALVPGPVTAPRLAALMGEGDVVAEELLERLVDHHLLEPGRRTGGGWTYHCPGLLRLYAAERLAAEEPAMGGAGGGLTAPRPAP
ncbi:AfsR/SARP family transcriptional regulator [Sphaerisporangium corydalis]|uniref:AfsR/SARP family transcriptional regulator n=1 Tax=Sphaerisporangium corydalis TaxID=1441875 RepID=UPI0021D17D4A|nr:BTAD domain-containing putative transcriptional regulator [Sphaerisporangium corydalis]